MNMVSLAFNAFKTLSQIIIKWLYITIQATTNATKVYKAIRETHDIYWFGMGGLYHPYIQLRIHDTILFTSIILSVDYKPLQFTPPIFANIDAHKEGVTPTVFRSSEITLKNLVIRLTTGHQDHYQNFHPEVSNPN